VTAPGGATPLPAPAGAGKGHEISVAEGLDDLDGDQIEALIRSLDELEAAPLAEPAHGRRLSPLRTELQ
jgi:hypothetical protein